MIRLRVAFRDVVVPRRARIGVAGQHIFVRVKLGVVDGVRHCTEDLGFDRRRIRQNLQRLLRMRCDHGCVEGLDLVVAVTNVDAIVEPVDGANRRVQADIPRYFWRRDERIRPIHR